MAYKHIETVELSSSQASITISGIPQGYDDLYIVGVMRGDNASWAAGADLRPNGSSADATRIRAFAAHSGTTAVSDTITAYRGLVGAGGTTDANTFGIAEIYITQYSSSNPKVGGTNVTLGNNSNGNYFTEIAANLWNNTSAITSIEFEGISTNLVAGTSVSIYGIS